MLSLNNPILCSLKGLFSESVEEESEQKCFLYHSKTCYVYSRNVKFDI